MRVHDTQVNTLAPPLHRAGRWRGSCWSLLAALMLMPSPAAVAGSAAASTPATLARTLLAATCKASDEPPPAPFVLLERTPLVRRASVYGERLRYAAGEGVELRVDRMTVDGVLRRVLVEVSMPTPVGVRPDLLVIADADCQPRGGRRLLRRADGSVEALQVLDASLAPAAPPVPLDAEVPPGTDPGGVAVAMVDAGVNYLVPGIASRLAREPDGTLIGYDWWDMDPRPFDAHPAGSPFFVQRHGTGTASLMLADAPVAKLVPYRYPRPDMRRMTALLEEAARHGVRIVNLSLGGNRREEWLAFEAAAAAQPNMLFIASAGNNGRDIDVEPVYPAALSLPNLLVVSSANDDGTLARGSNWGRRRVHLLVPAEFQVTTGFDGYATLVSGSSYAAARVSALAACLLAANPDWGAPELRAALVARAVPAPQPDVVAVGLLPEPLSSVRGACPAEPGEVVLDAGYSLSPAPAPVATRRARLALSLVLVRDTGWRAASLAPMLAEAARLLAQCGVVLAPVQVREVRAPRRLRYFSSRFSAALMPIAPRERPAVFLLDDTLEAEPFEAEAIGRGNAGRRRALLDTVWLTHAVRRPGLVLAHELVHLLTDSGTHDPDPRNLMAAQSNDSGGVLDAAQCARVVERGAANGLLSILVD